MSRTILKNISSSEDAQACDEIDNAKATCCQSAKKLQFDEKNVTDTPQDAGTPHSSPLVDVPMPSKARRGENISGADFINPNDLRKRLLKLKQEEAEILSGKHHKTNANLKQQILKKLKQKSISPDDDSEDLDEATPFESFEDKRRRFHKNEFIITKKHGEEIEELGGTNNPN